MWLMTVLGFFIVVLVVGSICLIARYAALVDPGRSEEAELKGKQLLFENLTHEQKQQYDRFGYFDVVGSKTGKRYRICHGTMRNVYELLEQNHLGEGHCFVPSGSLVAGDCMVAQKIMLENREEEALRVALRF
jgi:hypothetical protein